LNTWSAFFLLRIGHRLVERVESINDLLQAIETGPCEVSIGPEVIDRGRILRLLLSDELIHLRHVLTRRIGDLSPLDILIRRDLESRLEFGNAPLEEPARECSRHFSFPGGSQPRSVRPPKKRAGLRGGCRGTL